jgi:putative hemolysin
MVADESGATAGLVTVSDILQEILGGVADEFKTGVPSAERLPDGRLRMSGSLRLEDAASLLGAGWIGEASTLGGFLMERLERFPRVGEQLQVDGVVLEIESMSGRGVASVVAMPVLAPDEARARG